MSVVQKWCGVIFQNDPDQVPWIVPATNIPRYIQNPSGATFSKIYNIYHDNAGQCKAFNDASITGPGEFREGLIICVKDSLTAVKNYIKASRIVTPTLNFCESASALEESDIERATSSKRKISKQSSVSAANVNRAAKQDLLREAIKNKLQPVTPQQKRKKSKKSSGGAPGTPPTAQDLPTSDLDNHITLKHVSFELEGTEGKKSSKEKKKKEKSSAAGSSSTAPQSTVELNAAEPVFDGAVSDESSQNYQPEPEASNTQRNASKSPDVDEIIEIHGRPYVPLELVLKIQQTHDNYVKRMEGLFRRAGLGGIGQPKGSEDTSKVPFDMLPIWGERNGRVHIGFGQSMSKADHNFLLFCAKTPSIYIRHLVEHIFVPIEELLGSTIQGGQGSTRMDPLKLLVLQACLRKFLEYQDEMGNAGKAVKTYRSAKEVDTIVTTGLNRMIYSAKSDILKAKKKK